MDDPLAFARAELLRSIEELERMYAGLRDVDAGVSNSGLRKLRRLRTQVRRSKSYAELKIATSVATKTLQVVASELIKMLFETLSYQLPAYHPRRSPYDSWRSNQIPTFCCWVNA